MPDITVSATQSLSTSHVLRSLFAPRSVPLTTSGVMMRGVIISWREKCIQGFHPQASLVNKGTIGRPKQKEREGQSGMLFQQSREERCLRVCGVV